MQGLEMVRSKAELRLSSLEVKLERHRGDGLDIFLDKGY